MIFNIKFDKNKDINLIEKKKFTSGMQKKKNTRTVFFLTGK